MAGLPDRSPGRPALPGEAHLLNHPLHLQLQRGQAPPELLEQPLQLVLLALSRPRRLLGLGQPAPQLLHLRRQCLVCDLRGREPVMALLWWGQMAERLLLS